MARSFLTPDGTFLFDLEDLYGMTARVEWTPRPDEMVWAYEIAVNQ